MDEIGRYLRYVMPGVVYGVETIFLLWITCPTFVQDIISSNMGKDNLGAILGSVFVFGGLGYVFSVVHHVRHNMCNEACHEEDRILDHRLIIKKIQGKDISDPNSAMAASYALWFNQMNRGKIRDDANKKVCSLGHQAHGLGVVVPT